MVECTHNDKLLLFLRLCLKLLFSVITFCCVAVNVSFEQVFKKLLFIYRIIHSSNHSFIESSSLIDRIDVGGGWAAVGEFCGELLERGYESLLRSANPGTLDDHAYCNDEC